jgi:tRNA(fMet)-specific endonuclease VapC
VKYLLDTNTCIHYLRHGTGSPVASRLANAQPGDVVLCSMVLGELLFGALRSRDVAKNLSEVQAIAAITRAANLALVTHNTGEFSRVVGLTLEDWQV